METHERKKLITHYSDNISNTRDYWIKKNQSFYDEDRAFMKFLVEPNLNILDIYSDLLNHIGHQHQKQHLMEFQMMWVVFQILVQIQIK